MNIPSRFTAGDTLAWTDSLADYPSPTWTLSYTLFRAGHSPITFTGTQSGTSHAFAVSATSSGEIANGEWMWSSAVTDGTNRYTVGSGTVIVKPNLAAAAPGSDFRGPATIAYENVVSAINRLSAREVESITVNGRTVTYKDIDSLVKAEAILRPRMEKEQAAASGATVSNIVRVQFGRT